MGSKYILQTHPSVVGEDLKELSTFLVNQFWEHYKPLLQTDPYNCDGFPNHALKGKLRPTFRTLNCHIVSLAIVTEESIPSSIRFERRIRVKVLHFLNKSD